MLTPPQHTLSTHPIITHTLNTPYHNTHSQHTPISVADFPSGLKILKTEIGDASQNLQEQTADLGQLKAKYLALTGLSYEQSGRRKGALSRLRVFGGGGGSVGNGGNNNGSSGGNRNNNNNNNNSSSNNNNNNSSSNSGSMGGRPPPFQSYGTSATGSGSGTSATGSGSGSGSGLGSTPRRHNSMGGFPRGGKLPSHWLPTRMERLDHHISHNTDADVFMNLVVVSMFAFCLICTIFLANLISLIK